MKELLQESWALVQRYAQEQPPVPEPILEDIKAWYDEILAQGESEWSTEISSSPYVKGRVKKSKAAIPFDNNQTECDLRMVKVKQKVSRTFRTQTGAHIFVRLRSVISSLLKQKQNMLASLNQALCGKSVFK